MLENTTIRFEEENKCYYIDIPAKEQKQQTLSQKYKGRKIVCNYGTNSEQLRKIIYHLKNAKQYASNEHQKQMIEKLIQHYQIGNCDLHKDYSAEWVQDINPDVETYQGFIETYRDPIGVRAEFESMVAYQDKDSYQILGNLIKEDVSKQVLSLLPVEDFMQKDLKNVSYNGINILGFVTSGLPIGINIPNYHDVVVKYGNKNVSLINVLAGGVQKPEELQFIGKELQDRIFPLQRQSLSAEVALHELFGHGSCKLIYKDEYEKLTPDQQMYLNYKCYQEDQTYSSVFMSLQSPFEECRAELSAFYLNGQELIFRLFKVAPYDYQNYKVTGVYSMVECALKGLQQYDNGKWLQSHSQARFVILKNVSKRTDAVKIELKEDDKLEIKIDEQKLDEVFEAHKQLLKEFNVYRCSGDIQQASKVFNELSTVDNEWIEIRRRCILAKQPRKVYIGARLQKIDRKFSFEKVQYDDYTKYYEGVMTYVQNIRLANEIQ